MKIRFCGLSLLASLLFAFCALAPYNAHTIDMPTTDRQPTATTTHR